MAEESGAVRDHLANERTQLAWLRTGANVMVVGLAVARFAADGEVSAASLAAGALLILAGAGTVVYGTMRYRRVADELRHGAATTAAASNGPSVVAVLLLVCVAASTAILLLSI